MRIPRLLLIPVLAVALISTGCRHNINSSNPRVVLASSAFDAGNACNVVADGLTAAKDAVENLKNSEPEYYVHAMALIKRVNAANHKAIKAVRLAKTGDTSVDWRSAMVAVGTAAGNEDPALFGFKNPTSQKLAKAGFATLVEIISQIQASYGGK